MIDLVEIENFRCVRKATLRLGALTALVGPNGGGKSTLMEACRPLGRGARDVRRRDPTARGSIRTFAKGELQWTAGFGSDPAGTGGTGWVAQVLQLDLDALRGANNVSQSPVLDATGSNLANTLATLPRRVQADLAGQYTALLPIYADVDVRPGPATGQLRVVFQDRWDPTLWYEPADVSDGSMLVLAFLVVARQLTAPEILLIEEPERGLHPYLIGVLIDLLRGLAEGRLGGAPIQIVLATHSAELLEFLRPDEVRFVDRDDEGDVRISEVPAAAPDWETYFDTYRHSLGSAWLSGGLGGVPGR